tara:strand:+ start:827 stop:2356 length:1530 start_codon:yes stop_codon:yes gene_type:complete
MGIIYQKLKEHALSRPSKLFCIVDWKENLTFSEALTEVDRIAIHLEEHLGSNCSIAVQIEDPLENCLLMLAINKVAGCAVPLSYDLLPAQVERFLTSANARCIIVDERKKALLASKRLGVETIVTTEFHKRSACSSGSRVSALNFGYDVEQPYLITFSSGSTGDPKPLIYTEMNKIMRAEQAIRTYDITVDDIILNASPFYHSLGQRLTFLPLVAGCTSVLLKKFSAQAWIDAVERSQVSFTIPVSSHLHDLVEYIERESSCGGSLRTLVSSSAGISFDTKKRLMSLKNIKFHEMYGASEVATISNLRPDRIDKIKSVGQPLDGVQVQIWDENDKVLGINKVGEICAKSALASPGYLNRPDLTGEFFQRGYFKTGDLGYLDEEGFLYFAGRQKDIIISGGVNVYPSDIEPVLNEHPEVRSCCAIGLKDVYFGEIVVVVVETAFSDKRSVEKELRSLARQHLAKNQRPLRYFFREQMPSLPSGKLDKSSLLSDLQGIDLSAGSMLMKLRG